MTSHEKAQHLTWHFNLIMPPLPHQNRTSSLWTVLPFIVLLICCFPGLPQYILNLPLQGAQSFWKTTPEPVVSHSVCYTPAMSWFQKQFTLPSKSRGSYLITDDVVKALPEIKDYKVGILHLFVQHTSCALSLNENWDSDVREDMSDALDRIAPEDRKGNLYRHSAEGLDDMPVSM